MTPSSPRSGPDRRVTVGRVFSLLLQVFLAWFTVGRLHAILTGDSGAELQLLGAILSMVVAIVHGAMGLPGMLKAALGSLLYRVAMILSGLGIVLVSAAFLLVFVLPAAGVLPAGFLMPVGNTVEVSLRGGLATLAAFGAAILMTLGYIYGAGLISVLLVCRSNEKLREHWLFKDLDRQSDWDFGD